MDKPPFLYFERNCVDNGHSICIEIMSIVNRSLLYSLGKLFFQVFLRNLSK